MRFGEALLLEYQVVGQFALCVRLCRSFVRKGSAFPVDPYLRRGCASPARRSLAMWRLMFRKGKAFPHERAAEPQTRIHGELRLTHYRIPETTQEGGKPQMNAD